MLRHLDLFSGIGGFALGLRWAGGFETVAFCEIEKYPQKVLRKHWPETPIFEDVRELNADKLRRLYPIDVITAGYPCQPFSLAGKRDGAKDDRHLWPEVDRLLDAIRPRWFIGENVYGHISMGLDEVLSDLESLEYTAQAFVIPACAVDAPHRRDRLWIVANANGSNGREKRELPKRAGTKSGGVHADVANTRHAGVLQRGQHGDGGEESQQQARVRRDVLSGREQGEILADAHSINAQWVERGVYDPDRWPFPGEGPARLRNGGGEPARWPTEPAVGRVAHGIPKRVDRLRGLGNAVVPQVVERIGKAIMEVKK